MYEPTQEQLDHFKVVEGSYGPRSALILDVAFKSRMTWKEAFQLVIAKWVVIRRWFLRHRYVQQVSDGNVDTCALCIRCPYGSCSRCPVYKYTGEIFCRATPYIAYNEAESREESLKKVRAVIKFAQKLYAHLYGEV